MEFSQDDDRNNLSLSKFEDMLKTNHVLFFDSSEFETIIIHYLESGKISLAKKAIKLGLEQHPTSTALKLFKVETLIVEDKLDAAEALLNELYEIEPTNSEIYIQKASIFSRKDKNEEAIKSLLFALKVCDNEKDMVDIYALIGMEYLFLDQFENARSYFMKCLEANIHDYSAMYNIIYCFEHMEQNREAITFLNNYLNKNPYCEIGWHQLGIQYVAIKDYKKALTAFDFAIISDDTFIGAYLEKGKILEKQGFYKKAIENYEITLALDDPTSFALLRIGRCYEKLEQDDLAIQYYHKAIHEDPLLDKGWIAITKFHLKNQNYPKGLYYINKAINIDSNNVSYWKLYAEINHKLNFLEEAERGYKKTLELGNYELQTWLTRADILTTLGEFDSALNILNQALEFYTETPEIEFRLCGLYFLLGKKEEADFHLKNALKHNPEYISILKKLFPKVYTNSHIKNIIKIFKTTSD